MIYRGQNETKKAVLHSIAVLPRFLSLSLGVKSAMDGVLWPFFVMGAGRVRFLLFALETGW